MTLYVKSHNSRMDLTELCPFLDLEFWSNLCVQGLFSDTVYAVALKLNTLIQGYQMIFCVKSHNSGMDFV